MASSIFIFEISPVKPSFAMDLYNTLRKLPDEDTSYFNLQLLSDNELSGEYVTVQTIEETFYNSSLRSFAQREAQRASIVNFSVIENHLEIWGNKSSTNRLVFALSNAFGKAEM